MRPRIAFLAAVALAVVTVTACELPEDSPRAPKTTLIVGIDVSGSFRQSGHYDDAIAFLSHYLYAHLNGLGELRKATAVFVGSLGGERPGEPKTFHPIQDLSGLPVDSIAARLRSWFPETDPYTDFNAFFQRVAVNVKRQNLVLVPLNIVLLSDGMPDVPNGRRIARDSVFAHIDLTPLEFLSRSVTVRLLYGSPDIAQQWERGVKRKRVRFWTQDAAIMVGWRRHYAPGLPAEQQDSLWKWMEEIVDFRVRRGRVL